MGGSIFLSESVCANTSTATLEVTAQVTTGCSFLGGKMNFGIYSTLSPVDLEQQSSLEVNCSSGTAYSVSLDPGTGSGASTKKRAMTGIKAGALSYTLYKDSGHTQVFGDTGAEVFDGLVGSGDPQPIPVHGLVSSVDNPNPLEDNYADSVTATLSF